jgi:ammonium transporter, Amt family
MQEVNDALALQSATNLEFFYWVSIALMFLIHAGFLVYETGASRVKNVLASAMKNLMTLAIVIPSFFFVGWFLYNSMPTGVPRLDELAKAALPWSDNMGPNLQDSASGVFWGCFALFAATTASILSGAVIERIRLSAFLILATFLGSVVWIIGAAWGWHPAGWMLTELGFHDVGAAGCVHVIAGMFALGVLINLGPRIGRFVRGKAVQIRGHNLTQSMLGLMLIYVGFFGFLMGCVIYSGEGFTTIYGAPTNLSAWVFNILMGLAGGVVGAYLASRGEPFWCVSGGLAGVIASAAGLDVYHPALAFVVSIIGGFMIPFVGSLLEKRGIDDAVGAVAVHGAVGLWSLVAVGIFASGYPNVGGAPDVSIGGQLVGAVTFAALGFIPGYLISKVLAISGLLRIPRPVELSGLDLAEVPASAFPEGIPATPEPLLAATAFAHENGKPHDPIPEPSAS